MKRETNGNANKGDIQRAKTLARRLIEHHFKTKPLRMIHQPGGLTNQVFIVKHDKGDFVVRIGNSPEKINAYIKEQWVVRFARKAGVPTAEILEVGNEVIPVPYMISERARGQDAANHPERRTILRELGHYVSIVHTVKTRGFGSVFDWSSNQLSRNDSWRDFLYEELKLESRLELLKRYKMMPSSKITQLAEILEKGGGRKAAIALSHGDARLKNVLVDANNKITALIDWEHSMSNLVPHWDLALALHDLSIEERLEFLAGYGLSDERIREVAPLVKALNVINYAPYIEQAAKANDTSQMQRYRLALSGALDLYSL
jgi:hygromycin-B 4-O-kinase